MKLNENRLVGLLALGGLLMSGSGALALGPAPRGVKSVNVTVAEVVGTARMVTAEGVEGAVTVGSIVPVGAKLTTEAASRVALSITPKAGSQTPDLLMLGAGSKIEVVANTPQVKATEFSAPMTAKVHDGSYRAISRSAKPLFALQSGERVAYMMSAADVAGDYDARADDATYMVKTGSIVIAAGTRRIKLAEGMIRNVEGGRILAAKAFTGSHWVDFAESVTVPGVDTSMPKPAVTRKEVVPNAGQKQPPNPGEQKPLKVDTIATRDKSADPSPAPWEYDAENDQFWHPDHQHWHAGRPPAKPAASETLSDAGRNTDEGTPIPWQYDEKQNRYWNPDHGHWHPGRPPAGAGSAEPAVTPAPAPQPASSGAAPEYVLLRTSAGDITLELDAARAPISVANFLAYVEDGSYEGTIFHRVIGHFMIQGGGFTPDMQKKSGRPGIKNEWQNGLKNRRGTIAMARLGGQPDSATNQFFINVVDNDSLDVARDGAGYAVFGKVVKGLDVVDAIRSAPTGTVGRYGDVPLEPVIIEKATRVKKQEG